MRVDPNVKYAASLALALLLAAPLAAGPAGIGPRPAGAWEDDEETFQDDAPEPEEFEEDLAPHGDWLEVGDYGRVWHPWVVVGWQPYVDGYWSWSSWGWFWVSYEPWAWTFHYGRWALVPAYGWVWVPGTVWGPAWVDWYWGAGYVGWAPLAPFVTHVTVVDHFVFVHERDFCSRGIARRVKGHRLVPDQVIHEWRHREFRAPDRQHIERVSAHPVSRLERKPAPSLLPHHDRGRRGAPHLARPDAAPGLGHTRRDEPRPGRGRRTPGETSHLRAPDAPRRSPGLGRPPVNPGVGFAPAPVRGEVLRGRRRSRRGRTRRRPPERAAPARAGRSPRPRQRRWLRAAAGADAPRRRGGALTPGRPARGPSGGRRAARQLRPAGRRWRLPPAERRGRQPRVVRGTGPLNRGPCVPVTGRV
jgi:hypothetical protein